MTELATLADAVAAEHHASAVARVDRGGEVVLEAAWGLADRAAERPLTPTTRMAIASATKGWTALAVMSLVEDGTLVLDTTARSLLGTDLPLIDDAVTVEQLLTHRAGIGDYIDEDLDEPITAYAMGRPVHEFDRTEAYIPALDGYPTKFPPGERFSYCNGGYVVLALLAERASGTAFGDLLEERVCRPAGLTATSFERSDELPGDCALGYLPIAGRSRTNVHHLPVLGSGDGGLYSTVADVRRLWIALDAGAIVPAAVAARMREPVSDAPAAGRRYGTGFWLHRTRPIAQLEGYDAGVWFLSSHDPARDLTLTVISNTSTDAGPLHRALAEALDL